MSMPPRLGGYWVIALSLAAQAWPASNEAAAVGERSITLIALLWLFCSIFSRRDCFRYVSVTQKSPVGVTG
jgi:hypothetical protein